MSDNVVPLKPPPPPPPEVLVWSCSVCECSTFRCYSNGLMECAACAKLGPCEWVQELPDAPSEPKVVHNVSRVVSLGGTPQAALRNMLLKVDPTDLFAVVVISEDARVRTWGGTNEQDRVEWTRKRLVDAFDLLTMLVPKE